MSYKAITTKAGPRELKGELKLATGGGARQPATRMMDTGPKLTSRSYRLHRKQAAVHLGVSLSWLDKARMVGRGPAFIAIGSRVVYDLADLDAFLRQNRRETGFGP